MSDDENPALKRFRSPPYPYIPLGKAVDRARQLYPMALHHSVGMAVLADAWGYGAKSSGLAQTIGAMLQFGLLEDEGAGDKRKFKLSADGLRIVQDADPQSEKLKAAIKRAALAPRIHRELWAKYGSAQVSDLVLKNYLTLDRRESDEAPFSSVAAEALVEEYKSSISFAEIHDDGSLSALSGGGDTDEKEVKESFDSPRHAERGGHTRQERRTMKSGMKEDVFTLAEGDVVFQWPEQLSEASYEDLQAWAELLLRKIKRNVIPDHDRRDDRAVDPLS